MIKETITNGINCLFKENAKNVFDNANSFKGCGNNKAEKYLETVLSFAVALLKSLSFDTKATAELADVVIHDIKKNCEVYGTKIEFIESAYRGLSLNCYAMLDDLNLGFGNSKNEMQRLLATATKLSGEEHDINNLADVFNAIHVIQSRC